VRPRNLSEKATTAPPLERLARRRAVEVTSEDDGESVAFTRTYGDWMRLFRRHGLTIVDPIELRPPDGAVSTHRDYVTYEWARTWAAERTAARRGRKTGSKQEASFEEERCIP